MPLRRINIQRVLQRLDGLIKFVLGGFLRRWLPPTLVLGVLGARSRLRRARNDVTRVPCGQHVDLSVVLTLRSKFDERFFDFRFIRGGVQFVLIGRTCVES